MTASGPDLRRPRASGLLFLLSMLSVFAALPDSATAQQDLQGNLPSLGGSEAPSIRIENIGLSDGLAQGSIYQMIQDRNGFIWFGTQGGLHRYDGSTFKVYAPVPFDTTSLSAGWVFSVAESADGSLWVGTNAGGLNRMDPVTGRFEHFQTDPEDSTSLGAISVFDVLEASDSTIWVATGNGLDRMDRERTGVFSHFRSDANDPNSISSNGVYYLHEDADLMIWAATEDGLNRLDPLTGQFKRYFYHGIGRSDWGDPQLMLDMYEAPGEPGILWVGSGRGLIRMDYHSGESKLFVPFPEDEEGSSRTSISSIAQDPADASVLWLGSIGGGLLRFDMRNGRFDVYANDPGSPNSPSSNWVNTVFTDRTGGMWEGTGNEGLGRFNPASVRISQIGHDPEATDNIMTEGTPWGMLEDREGRFWLSTTTYEGRQVLTRYDLRTGALDRFENDPTSFRTILRGNIQSIYEDRAGYLWIGTNGGLSKCDPVSMVCEQYTSSKDDSTTISAGRPQSIYESPSKPGVLWVGTAFRGLNRMDVATGTFKRYPFDANKPDGYPPFVEDITEDSDGTMWLGTYRGLYRVDPETEVFTQFTYDPADSTTISSRQVMTVIERKREPGVLWLATRAGLNRFDIATGKARHFMQKDGLANDVLYGMIEDDAGILWMSSNHGIISFDPDTETIRNYGLDDGLEELEFMQNGYAKGAGNVLYFGNVSGVTVFIPSELSTNPTAPPIAFTGLRVKGKTVQPGKIGILDRPIADAESITLAYSQNEFSIDYVALHFSNPTENRYAYMLEGYDEDWVDAGFQRTASFTNLDPGQYTFRVKAANSDGVWNEEGISLAVRINPPWYRTPWAYTLGIVLLGGFIFGFDRVQRFRLVRKERQRAEIEESRLRAQTAEARSQALQAENERKKNIERLSEIGKEITASLEFDTIFERLYEHVNDLTDAPIFGVGVYHEEAGEIEYRLAIENGKHYTPYSRDTSDKNQFPVWCIENREAVFINDVEKEYSRYIESYEYAGVKLEDGTESQAPCSLIYLPLITQDRVQGVITVQSFEKNAYTEDDLNLLKTMASYASVAMDNSNAYRELNGTLVKLKQTQQQLVQQEKMASLGQLTAGVAHEIKNPLNFVNNFADLNVELAGELRELVENSDGRSIEDIQKEMDDLVAGLQLNAQQISKHGRRADSIVKGMMQHTHHGSSERFPVAVNAFVEEYVNLAWHGMRAGGRDKSIDIERDYDESAGNVSIAPQEMGRVLVNLINNAFDAAGDEEKPEVTISTRRRGKKVEIRVSDNGSGVPEALQERIFEPFFTTKPTGKGTGLGLSLSHDIVTQGHGGSLTVEKSPKGGASFVVVLPEE